MCKGYTISVLECSCNEHIIVIVAVDGDPGLLVIAHGCEVEPYAHALPVAGQAAEQAVLGVVQLFPQIADVGMHPQARRAVDHVSLNGMLRIAGAPIGPSREKTPSRVDEARAVRVTH